METVHKHTKIGAGLFLGGFLLRVLFTNEKPPGKEEIEAGGSFRMKDVGTIMMVIGGGYLLFGKTNKQ